MAVEADVERLFAEVRDLVKSERKRLAVLVNNAAEFVFGHVTEVTEADWDKVLGTKREGVSLGNAWTHTMKVWLRPSSGRSTWRSD